MTPTTEAALADLITAASGPLHVRGGGTRTIGRPVVGEVLDTSGLSGVTLYEPGALTLVAQAGTPLAEITALLATEHQRLAFEPPDLRGLLGTDGNSTIGGVVAANASGPRRVQAGACRDFLLGVRYIDGTGAVVKNGGRVMKNVTGYDLVKLMAGSHGTLGVLTEVSLKVLPTPETAACIILEGLDWGQAQSAMSRALGSPFDVTGVSHAPDDGTTPARTMIRIEGFEGSVAYRAEQIAARLAEHAPQIERDPDTIAAHWAAVRDVAALHDHACVWKLHLKPSDSVGLAADMRDRHGLDALSDWGGGLLWLGAKSDDNTASLHHEIQTRTAQLGGHATLVKAPQSQRASLPVLQPEAAPVAALSAGLRAKFDPRGILNPGLMAG
ncbi:FAD-binding protein [Sagittula sp. SSi028]|uniref:FAD-binding protein n=1 Tax=Sagittula sp. SSi028 TaxID=3400636 RepID=UPI003AF6D707